MGTKINPGKWDCYAKALPDEPLFVLLGRDPFAAECVRYWCSLRSGARPIVYPPPDLDNLKVAEADACADAMEAYATSVEKPLWP